MTFHVTHLLADDSHEILSLIWFLRAEQILKCRLQQILGDAFIVKVQQ